MHTEDYLRMATSFNASFDLEILAMISNLELCKLLKYSSSQKKSTEIFMERGVIFRKPKESPILLV